MRVAMIEPEYFPGAHYFVPFLRADSVHLSTNARYRRQTSHNRTRLRNADGWQWITIPVGHGQFGRALSEIHIQGDVGWRTRHAKALRFNYESAPFYMYYAPKLHAFWAKDWKYLVDATSESVLLLADLLGVSCDVSQDVSKDVDQVSDGAPAANDIPYTQNFPGFLPGMSAIDLLMNHGPQSRSVLEAYNRARV